MISVVQACCRGAAISGHDATLLLLLPPDGHAAEFGGVKLDSLGAQAGDPDAPSRFIAWLKAHPQDVVLLNGCEQIDDTLPFIPTATRSIYVVHDTASRYFQAAVRHEAALDAIVAVSETVATRIRPRLKNPEKLAVVYNGSVLPIPMSLLKGVERASDLVFLGGDKVIKGGGDILLLWPHLLKRGFGGRLHWFGTVGEDFRRKVDRLRLGENIVFHGRVDRRTIFETALRSKACLMLSRVEPFGMATVECMAMGCGIAAWDIETGTKEIVTGSREGRFAPLGDLDALANSVMDVLVMPDEARLSMAERVRGMFSEEAMWARYETLIQRLLVSPALARPLAGQTPPPYSPPGRLFQQLPAWLRRPIRELIGRSARLGHALRDMRGY